MFSTNLAQKQIHISEFFTKVLEKNYISRSYLFIGNALEDKVTLVKELNQILNCDLNKGAEKYQAACGKCQNCKWIASDTHPRTPINVVGSTEKKKLVSVENLRENILPQLAQNSDFFRIVIIEDASNTVLTKEPATTLLKTIEEAKPNIMFVLFAEQEDSVLNTIKSRSQVLRFNSNEIKSYSEEAREKYQEIKSLILNSNSSKLDQMLASEQLAEIKSEILIEILAMAEEEIASSENDPKKMSAKILLLEKSIQRLKAFVRPKSQLYEQAKELSKI